MVSVTGTYVNRLDTSKETRELPVFSFMSFKCRESSSLDLTLRLAFKYVTISHELSQTLKFWIQPYLNASFIINSNDDILVYIKGLKLNAGSFLISFDVTSLFTNVPVEKQLRLLLMPPMDTAPYHLLHFNRKIFAHFFEYTIKKLRSHSETLNTFNETRYRWALRLIPHSQTSICFNSKTNFKTKEQGFKFPTLVPICRSQLCRIQLLGPCSIFHGWVQDELSSKVHTRTDE